MTIRILDRQSANVAQPMTDYGNFFRDEMFPAATRGVRRGPDPWRLSLGARAAEIRAAQIDKPREGLKGEPRRAGTLNREVFDQDKYWWDRNNKMHVVELMDKRYLLNVLLFCYENHREKFEPRSSPLIQKIRERLIGDDKES